MIDANNNQISIQSKRFVLRKPNRIDIVAFAYGAWLSGMMLVQFLMGGGPTSVMIGFAGAAVPAGLHLWLLGVKRGNDQLGLILFGGLAAIILISLLANSNRFTWHVAPQALGLFIVAAFGYLVAQHGHQRLLERIFLWTAILLAVVLLIVLIDNDRHWTRLMGRIHHNLWAAVALAAIPGALFIRNKFVAVSIAGFVIYMIGFQFGARGPLIYAMSIVFSFAAFWALLNREKALTQRMQFLYIVIVGAISVFIILNWDFLTRDVLMLDSATRGLGSGFTGRTELWTYLIGIGADHPFAGVGFRMHDQFVLAPGLYSAHNAYIAMLVDLGVIGLTIYLTMLGLALWRAGARYRSPLVVAYLIGYIFLGLTEARALNVGNPASILFIISLMSMLSTRSMKRSADSVGSKSQDRVLAF